MLHRQSILTLLLLVGLVISTTVVVAQGPTEFVGMITTESVMSHVRALSVGIGARPMGSQAEAQAAAYIAAALTDWGYAVEIQEFESSSGESEAPFTSRNVIATRFGDDQIIVVGAHMDSVTDGTGAGDNASGVAAMLAAAEALADLELAHTMMFVAFGAEEGGNPSGAQVFVERLGDQTDQVIAMINLDSVGIGSSLNVYAGAKVTWPEDEEESSAPTIEGGPIWVRDLALDLAAEMGITLGTTPDDTWGGFTGDWSDHYAFVVKDVPIAYFEAWNWGMGEDPWWGQETAEGDYMHTPNDVYENVVPQKVENAAEVVAALVAALATGVAAAP